MNLSQDGEGRLRVALAFFGITRSLRWTAESIRTRVIGPARAMASEVRLFGHFFDQQWIDNPRSGETGALDPEEFRQLDLDDVKLEPPGQCLDQYPMDRIMAAGDYWSDEFVSLRNLVHQLHSLRCVTESLLDWAPDIVIFARPDLYYHDDAGPCLARLATGPASAILVPDWCQWRGHNDRFGFARGTDCIRSYGLRAARMDEYCATGVPLHSESLLKFALDGLPVGLMSLRASRVRSNGLIMIEDFSPGRGSGGLKRTMPFAEFQVEEAAPCRTADLAPVVSAARVGGPVRRLAPMQLFHDVPVVPVTKVKRLKGQGGPIWPEFDAQTAARFCRNGIACDDPPRRPARLQPLREPAVWGGFLAPQFGHLVAEHLTRLPQSLRDRPEDLYVFTTPPGMTEETLPGYVWDVIDWYGLRRDRVCLVDHPLMARELRVAAQGDMLGGVPACPEYLETLDAIARRNGLRPEPSRFVFVTRAGLVAKGMGGHAGESYLAAVLQDLGVTVIEPGQLTIRRQMEVYAGGETLIFAEGSALHGRCMLGHLAQDIHVLRRRPNRNTAQVQLASRCSRLTYHPVLAGRLGTRTDLRGNRYDLDLSLYDPALLFAVFDDIGIPLRPRWDTEAYLAAVRADLVAWMAKVPTSADQMAENLDVLADLDLLPDPVSPPPSLQRQT